MEPPQSAMGTIQATNCSGAFVATEQSEAVHTYGADIATLIPVACSLSWRGVPRYLSTCAPRISDRLDLPCMSGTLPSLQHDPCCGNSAGHPLPDDLERHTPRQTTSEKCWLRPRQCGRCIGSPKLTPHATRALAWTLHLRKQMILSLHAPGGADLQDLPVHMMKRYFAMMNSEPV